MSLTPQYRWDLPDVGADEDAWGELLRTLWTDLDTMLGGTNATEFAILNGATVSTAELNILDGVTAGFADINKLTGLATTAAELGYVNGVTSAIQTQIDTKAPSASPALTGTPTAPTAATTTDTTQIATTAFVQQEIQAAPQIKAWVTFDGTSGTSIDARYNVSSVTYNGTGDYTINFTNAMDAATYCVQATCRGSSAGVDDWSISLGTSTDTKSTTAVQVRTIYIGGVTHAAADSPEICVSIIE